MIFCRKVRVNIMSLYDTYTVIFILTFITNFINTRAGGRKFEKKTLCKKPFYPEVIATNKLFDTTSTQHIRSMI